MDAVSAHLVYERGKKEEGKPVLRIAKNRHIHNDATMVDRSGVSVSAYCEENGRLVLGVCLGEEDLEEQLDQLEDPEEWLGVQARKLIAYVQRNEPVQVGPHTTHMRTQGASAKAVWEIVRRAEESGGIIRTRDRGKKQWFEIPKTP